MKTRFSPSPTGLMHLGNARTALFNKLLAAHSSNGRFLLRIEDTDKLRSNPEYTRRLKDDLHWLGLSWDEGPECEAAAGPYEQSNRQTIYDKHYSALEQKGLIYPCFCTEEELAATRKRLLKQHKPPRYLGTCRHLTDEQIQVKKEQGLLPCLRFRVPDDDTITFVDTVKGEQQAPAHAIGDFIIRRVDGTPPFLFCNALDDALMGVTHVLRGEDHLTNTFRQVMLLRALALPCPHYGHIALILGGDGAPLSKRNGSESIDDLREQGFLPLALANYMARLGHHMSSDEVLSLAQLSACFSVQALALAPARFDKQQLQHWQKQVLLALPHEELWAWMGPTVQAKVHVDERDAFVKLTRDNVLFPCQAEAWATILYDQALVCQATDELAYQVLTEAGVAFFKAALTLLQHTPTQTYKTWIEALKTQTGLKGKALFLPVRVAMTGRTDGPSLEGIFELLARDALHWVALRMSQAIELVSGNTEQVETGGNS